MTRQATFAAVVLSALAVPAGAATFCVNPAGSGGCQSSIQAAVNMAAGGDIVKIAAGTYFENVTVPAGKDALQIVGASKLTTILDPDAPNSGDGILVQSNNVVIKGLGIRNGQANGIRIQGNGTLVQGVRITGLRGAASNGIVADATYTGQQILTNEIRSVGQAGVFLNGNDDSIVKSNILGYTVVGVLAAGNNTQVLTNKISQVLYGVLSQGNNVTIAGNNVQPSAIGIYHQTGADPVIQSNKVTAAYIGGLVVCNPCTGGTMLTNTGVGTAIGWALQTNAAGFVMQANKASGTLIPFYVLSGLGVQATLNAGSGGGAGLPCFLVNGNGHTLTKNTITRCEGVGFFVNGSTNTLDANAATFSVSAGFMLAGNGGGSTGNTFTNNKSLASTGQGFTLDNAPAGTTLTGNLAYKDRVDLCDEGTGTTLTGNNFITTSTTCDILP